MENNDSLNLRGLARALDGKIAENRTAADNLDSLRGFGVESSEAGIEYIREMGRRLRDPNTREAAEAELDREYEASQAAARKKTERYFDECIARGIRPQVHMRGVQRMFDEYAAKKAIL